MAKRNSKTAARAAVVTSRAPAVESDDTVITALKLEPAKLSPEMAAYFAKCEEKLGFVPNVLKAYAFDTAKLSAFVAMYNDLMLAPSGLSKLEREMIAVAVSAHNRCYYCLVAHGAAVRQLSGDPVLGELMAMNFRAARLSKRERASSGDPSEIDVLSASIASSSIASILFCFSVSPGRSISLLRSAVESISRSVATAARSPRRASATAAL